MIDSSAKQSALAWLAAQFVGISDKDSGAYLVKKFQRAVGGKAQGEPWCAAFALYCVDEVDDLANRLDDECVAKSALPQTESTQALWAGAASKSQTPVAGSIAVWRELSNAAFGHCGVVTAVDGDDVMTCEGNTSGQLGGDQRSSGVVWAKTRAGGQIPGFALLGYVNPWG